MSSFVHLVCDYAAGDLAWSEVMAAFAARLPDNARVHCTAVDSFDTIATGFVVAQLALADVDLRPQNLLVFANTAPRKDKKDARTNNEGEGLLFATLKNGVQVIAVNSGHSLSFVRSELQELWSTTVDDGGSQFRSRDFFPSIVGSAAKGDFSFINHRLDPTLVVPEEPREVIGYVDSFGNVKTTFRAGDSRIASLSPGSRVKVIIGSSIRTATIATGSFNIMEGDLAFAPGSSGHDRRYWELFKRGGSAHSEFAHPATGTPIKIQST